MRRLTATVSVGQAVRPLGIPIARSTLTDLFHQVARQLAPLSARLVQLVAASEIVSPTKRP